MNDNSAPLISVLVAVYNGASTLQQCINSVALQTYRNKELIVIDGGSTDGTVAICEENSEKISYWVSEKDNGVFSAWNKGLREAKGEWVCFLGADDYFLDDAVLEQISGHLKALPENIRLAYAQVLLVSADGGELFPVGEPWEKIGVRFGQGLCLPHQGVMHRRSLFELNGMFDESFRIAGDYELLLRELKSGEAVFIPGIILAAMRQGGLSSTPSNALETMCEIRRAQQMHGQTVPSLFWVSGMVKVYIKLILLRLIGERTAKKVFDVCRRFRGLPAYWTRT
jgi:glycosyltransferase involved in cell wall biosynthesis